MSIAKRLGYISVVETLKDITEVDATAAATQPGDEKYKIEAPETMQENFVSDSEDEGGMYVILQRWRH